MTAIMISILIVCCHSKNLRKLLVDTLSFWCYNTDILLNNGATNYVVYPKSK